MERKTSLGSLIVTYGGAAYLIFAFFMGWAVLQYPAADSFGANPLSLHTLFKELNGIAGGTLNSSLNLVVFVLFILLSLASAVSLLIASLDFKKQERFTLTFFGFSCMAVLSAGFAGYSEYLSGAVANAMSASTEAVPEVGFTIIPFLSIAVSAIGIIVLIAERKLSLQSIKNTYPTILLHMQLVAVAVIVLYPILWITGTSLNPLAGLANAELIPSSPTLANFRKLFDETNFWMWYRNTLTVALLTTLFAVVLNTFTAFVFARFPFRGRKMGLLIIMILQMFPTFLGMTAIYVIFLTFGMLDNVYMLVFIYVAGSIPFNIWLVRGYMLNIPRSLDEAATIDGATKMKLFTHIIFPLSKPIVAFMAVTAFMAPWMDFILPRLLLSRNVNFTVAIGLFNMADATNPNYDINAFAAGCIVIGVPIALLYMVFQRYLLMGLTAGANKGE